MARGPGNTSALSGRDGKGRRGGGRTRQPGEESGERGDEKRRIVEGGEIEEKWVGSLDGKEGSRCRA